MYHLLQFENIDWNLHHRNQSLFLLFSYPQLFLLILYLQWHQDRVCHDVSKLVVEKIILQLKV